MDGDAAIIEVGLNENVGRDRHPHVPCAPEEVAADAVRCGDAGATVVHWHARDPVSGAPRLDDAALYAAALTAMRRGHDVLAYPTYPAEPGESVDQRFGHVWALASHGLELAPVDLGSVNLPPWDRRARRFLGDAESLGPRGTFVNSTWSLLEVLDRARALRLVPAVSAFDVGFTRTMVHLVDAGALVPPVYLKIFLSDGLVAGPFPDEVAIDAHLAQIPSTLDVEWCVVPFHVHDDALVERLCRAALERGGGVRVGIGDNPDAHPTDANAALVERAVRWVEEAGRRPASPAALRARLGLPAHPASAAPAGEATAR